MKRLIFMAFLLSTFFIACQDDDGIGANPSEIPNESEPEEPREGALVIKHGWDIPTIRSLTSPEFVKEVEESPYDGIMFSANQASRLAFYGRPLSQTVIDQEFEAMTPNTLSRPMHNYVRLHVDTIAGGYNGPNLDVMVDNMRRFAAAAKASGFEGIAFDNENYWGDAWHWIHPDSGQLGVCPGLTREECAQATYEAGYKMMDAIIDEWPDVHIIPFFGIWLRDEPAWDFILMHSPGNKWYNPDKVEAEFLVGIYAAIHDRGNTATFIDGGELYGLREQADFQAISDYLRNDLPMTTSHIPDELRQSYAEHVNISFGIYDFRAPLFNIPTLRAGEFRAMIENAIPTVEYIWLYPELYDYWEHDDNFYPLQYAPDGWKNAISSALGK